MHGHGLFSKSQGSQEFPPKSPDNAGQARGTSRVALTLLPTLLVYTKQASPFCVVGVNAEVLHRCLLTDSSRTVTG